MPAFSGTSAGSPTGYSAFADGRWHAVGGTFQTAPGGMFRQTVRAGPGAQFRFWSPRDETFSPVLVVR